MPYPRLHEGDWILPSKPVIEIVQHDARCTCVEGVVDYGQVLSLSGDSTRGYSFTNMEHGVGCIKGPCP